MQIVNCELWTVNFPTKIKNLPYNCVVYIHTGVQLGEKEGQWSTVQRCRSEAADGGRPDSGRHVRTDHERLRKIQRQILAQTFSDLLYFENVKFEQECVPHNEDIISSRNKEYEEDCP